MTRKILLCGAALTGLIAVALMPSAALASADDYIIKFCADGACANPTTERMQMRPTWDAMTAAGTANFVGGSIDSIRLTPATMVAGARVLGIPAFDTMLRTGQVPFAGGDARRAAIARMTSVQNVDINSTVGLAANKTAARDPASLQANATTLVNADGTPNLNAVAGILTGPNSSIPNQTSTNGCDAQVAQMQIASGANFANNIATLAGSSAGFSRSDGQGAAQSYTNEIGSGGRPMSAGFTGQNCLSNLFNFANLDIMFKPPLMNNMMNQLTGMRCGSALAGATGVNSPLPTNVFQTLSMGGFFPGMNMSQYAGGLNGAATGNFTGIANMAKTLSGSDSSSSSNFTQTATIGSLFSGITTGK